MNVGMKYLGKEFGFGRMEGVIFRNAQQYVECFVSVRALFWAFDEAIPLKKRQFVWLHLNSIDVGASNPLILLLNASYVAH